MPPIHGLKPHLTGRLRSFGYAANGIKYTAGSQLNFRIHLVAVCIAVACGALARLSATEWCILLLTIGLVITIEAMNTAIEILVDLVSPGYEKQAGIVKDVAAGAVLMAAAIAVIVGVILFLPRLL